MKRYTLTHTDSMYNWLSDNLFTLTVVDYDASEQLRSCQAWMIPFTMVCDYDRDEVWEGYLLQSYNTIVSFVAESSNGEILTVRLGKWSPTTSRQQTWFERDVEHLM